MLLGHKELNNSAHYNRIDSCTLKAIKSPLEYLKQEPQPPA